MGKSTAVSDLLTRLHSEFELVICFVGSAACNPTLKMQLQLWYDERFFFSEWSCPLMAKLLIQQEDLKSRGVTRNVLILVDDVVLTSKAEDQLCHLAMRGRHFNISLMCCSVSYTSIPKSCRRSLDVLLLFSCPMSGGFANLDLGIRKRQRDGEVCGQQPGRTRVFGARNVNPETVSLCLAGEAHHR